MFINLDGTTIVNAFKADIKNIPFIPQSDYCQIEERLDMLINIKHSTNRRQGYGRFAKTQASKWLWEYFFYLSLNNITTNMRGYNELLDFYNEYIHYENVLFTLVEDHRDHVIHSVWVMLIGCYLIKTCRPLVNIEYNDVLVSLDRKLSKPTNMIDTQKIIKNKELFLWFLIALTHDLGYPIQKTIEANRTMSKMIDNFGFLSQTEFSYRFDVIHSTAMDELLNTLSAHLFWVNDKEYKIGYSSGTRLDYAKSFEALDHGIMSAYLVQKYIDFICEVMSVPRGIDDYVFSNTDTAARTALIITWLRAISAHTSDNVYWASVNGMTPLLSICDELDEFSRYSHQLHTDQWRNVECETQFNCTRQSIEYKYTFRKRIDFNILSFFKAKISKIASRFDLARDGINKISITCIDNRKGRRHQKYYYEHRCTSPGLGFVKRYYGKTSDDIIGFIKGRVEL